MRVKRVRITNFRCLQDIEIEFDQITTFIGPNGVGKSTVLRALDWFFNGAKVQLREIDCSHGNTSEEIRVRLSFPI
ncbi:MAG: AAA family ATPase [Actinomycetota bacterium]